MCGICGFFDPTFPRDEAERQLERMLDSIAHRGPDARGKLWDNGLALGHNRLSIIDLSHDADQPMVMDNLAVVFNGEIYNYMEIRKELSDLGHSFRTQSDTEVLLASYKEWGTNCVEHFVGMWAFVLVDLTSRFIMASRDRFGIKPLYYMTQSGKFYFASEIKTLKLSPIYNNDIDLNQVSRGLQLGWLSFGNETYFKKVLSVPAAHSLFIQLGPAEISQIKCERYWDINTSSKSTASLQSKIDQFRSMFTESIKLHMRSDVPVATCLSGGLDSSAIVSMVQCLHPDSKYKSFSIYYDGEGDVDERPFIHEVIGKYPSVIPFYKRPTEEEIRNEFHRALFHADVPATGSSFLSQYFLMKLIRENDIKVVLDGQGSDEYLAGYMHSFYRLIGGELRKGRLIQALGRTRSVADQLGLSLVATASHLSKSLASSLLSEQKLYRLEYQRYFPFLMKDRGDEPPFSLNWSDGTRLDTFLYNLIFNTSLPSLLQYEDRNSMAFSIESRVPFLDHRLVEFAFTLNDEDRINGNQTKYILRRALEGVLPDAITNRKDKKGFVTPGENKWLKGPLSFLLDVDYGMLDFLNEKKLAGLIRDYRNGDNSKSLLVWRVATLNYWLKNFV